VAGFQGDIIKASIVAVLLAALLGGTAYVLNRRIGIQVPNVGTLDAYTARGGIGKNNASDFYYSNQEIPVFAHVEDTSNNPVEGADLEFEISGPPNSNIIITDTTATNNTGYSVIYIPVPRDNYPPEKVLGTWSIVATTEIAGVQITDSLAFEVKAPPSPFIDLYTDRGGTGLTKASQPYSLNETIQLFAAVNNGTTPIGSQSVAFTVYDPNGAVYYVTTSTSNSTSGIAATEFRIAPGQTQLIGIWKIIATVRFEDQILIDALTFECTA
jgi:hypothetical protein